MDVREAAMSLGVTPRRVRAMIADGRITARRAGSRWVIDELAQPKRSRALSETSWRRLTTALKLRTLEGLAGQARARTAARIRSLREAQSPSQLLRDWRPKYAEQDLWGDTLFAHATRGDDTYLRNMLRRPTEYLHRGEDLAQVVAAERAVRGLSRRELAELADVTPPFVSDIESVKPLSSPGQVMRVLRALNIEATSLPEMALA
ncbi:helix-turn-helix domain-containing protein [Leucobacter sp. HY1908]